MFKLGTNQRFRHVIRDHILRWTVFDGDLVPVNQVSNVKVLDMEMTCALSRARFTILFQMHGAGVVSIDNVGFDLKALSFNEKFRPKDLRHNVVKSYEFCFSRTSSVDLLFHRDGADGTRTKRHCGSSVTFHVLVDGECSIDMPLDSTCVVSTHARDVIFRSFKIVHHLHKLLPISFIGFSDPCCHKCYRDSLRIQ